MHGSDLTILAPDNDDGILANFHNLVVTLVGNLTAVQGVQPALEHQVLELALKDQVGAVKVGVDGVLRPGFFRRKLLTEAAKGVINLCGYEVHELMLPNLRGVTTFRTTERVSADAAPA